MFVLPRIHARWTSEQTDLEFVEFRTTHPETGRIGYHVFAWLPSGYVTSPLV